MSLSKLKKIHVIIIGSVLCVIAAVAMFFLQIRPQKLLYAQAEADFKTHSVKGNPEAKAAALKAQADAQMALNLAQAQWDVQMKLRMPNLNFSRREIGMLALWKEQIKTLGPLLESFAKDKSVRTGGLNLQIPAPPANPNDPLFEQDVLVFPLGSITVAGDFKGLMANIRRWNNCRRLVMVGTPTLSGVSPELTQTYSLTCYVFPAVKALHDEKHLIPLAPGGTATAAAPAAGGAPGAPAAPAAPPM